MMHLFLHVSQLCSEITTQTYSTSFSSAIRLLHQDLRAPIYNIYGFVRFADEIVDTFHAYDQKALLDQFEKETYDAIKTGISLNPILHSFQRTVNTYGIDHHLIAAFFRSMRMDMDQKRYNSADYTEYIYGSAESVGLMCLYIFCEGDKGLYDMLQPAARSLGAAFQKVNFLRDMKADYQQLKRLYFPCCDFDSFSKTDKQQIEIDIQRDFENGYKGILLLPVKARFGVYVAYKYYFSLFKKIQKLHPQKMLERRVRIAGYSKAMIVMKAGLRDKLNIL